MPHRTTAKSGSKQVPQPPPDEALLFSEKGPSKTGELDPAVAVGHLYSQIWRWLQDLLTARFGCGPVGLVGLQHLHKQKLRQTDNMNLMYNGCLPLRGTVDVMTGSDGRSLASAFCVTAISRNARLAGFSIAIILKPAMLCRGVLWLPYYQEIGGGGECWSDCPACILRQPCV